MKLIIENKPYEIEFTYAAAMYEDCVDGMFKFIGGAVSGAVNKRISSVFKSLVGTPKLTVTLFYAGLMEHNPVESEKEAFELLKKYFYENKGKKDANFGGMFVELTKQMETDGFLDLIGLTEAMNQLTESANKQTEEMAKKVVPMDHQKTKATQK